MQISELPDPAREVRDRQARGAPRRSPLEAPARLKLVVVGNGMVGHHFCERAVSRGLLEKYEIAVFGEEAHAPYDRVRLGELIEGGSLDALSLVPKAKHERPGLSARRGSRVVAIHREEREVELADGSRAGYDQLVLATGSRPVLPNLPGVELDGVVVYRVAEDAQTVRREALRAAERGEPAVVVGAGLLGLEVAEQLVALGVSVSVVESAPHLLPRQLDERAAALLYDALRETGLEFHLNRRVTTIDEGDRAKLALRLSGGELLSAGLVIFAVGVRPRDELARSAGLACDLFGGVEVDHQLATSDPRIFAIGECARCGGFSYGLVAPGYDMAEVVVERLLGNDARFDGTQPVTRLKTKAVEVWAIGESAFDSPELRAVVHQSGRSYRRLTLRADRIVGASVIGGWSELAQAQQAVARRQPLRRSEERRFMLDRPVWSKTCLSLDQWPDDAPVCSCTGVTSGALKRAHKEGHHTVEALVRCTGAGSVCGSCHPLLASLTTRAAPPKSSRADAALLWVSAAAALLVVAWLVAPPIPYAKSVTGLAHDASWRDPWLKQLTGASLVLLLAFGSSISLRKRVQTFRWGAFGRWRLFHSLASLGAACVAIAHTGLRLGSNFNALLMLTFLASGLCGAMAGLAAILEGRLPAGVGQRLRARANRLHLYLAWPLPVLITFHVLKFYYF